MEDMQVLFYQYIDTIYKNDVWTYDAEQKEWKEVKTWGKAPENRSNCSMNYDEKTNQLVVFGGGGSNKRKFNSIYTLDWKTKEWREVVPKSTCLVIQPTKFQKKEHIIVQSSYILIWLCLVGKLW